VVLIMVPAENRSRLALTVGLAAVLCALPACATPPGPGGVRVVPAPEPLPQPPGYIAYRPIYSRLLQPKTLTLSNYAGANYPTVAPGAMLTPTWFGALTGHGG
jgi:hypothetical protein